MLLEANRASIAARYGADAPELAQTSARYRVSRAQLHLPASPDPDFPSDGAGQAQ